MEDNVSKVISDASSLLSTFNKLERLDLQLPHIDLGKCETELDIEIAMRDFLIGMYKCNEKEIEVMLQSSNPKIVEHAKMREEEQKKRLEEIKEKEKRIEELKKQEEKRKKQEELEYQKRQEALRIQYEKQWAKWRK